MNDITGENKVQSGLIYFDLIKKKKGGKEC